MSRIAFEENEAMESEDDYMEIISMEKFITAYGIVIIYHCMYCTLTSF